MNRSRTPWGALVLVGYGALVVGVTFGALRYEDRDRSGDPGPGERVVLVFVEAWQRSREATFVTHGTFERRSEVTGAAIASEDVVAQRPPRRLHRQLGGIEGRDDDRLLLCPAPPEGQPALPCQLGPRAGPSYAESVALEVEGLRAILVGPDPLYAVRRDGAACFELTLRRADPRAHFGTAAELCFDPATGAPSSRRIRHPGGIEETLVVTSIQATVTDADLDPAR